MIALFKLNRNFLPFLLFFDLVVDQSFLLGCDCIGDKVFQINAKIISTLVFRGLISKMGIVETKNACIL